MGKSLWKGKEVGMVPTWNVGALGIHVLRWKLGKERELDGACLWRVC